MNWIAIAALILSAETQDLSDLAKRVRVRSPSPLVLSLGIKTILSEKGSGSPRHLLSGGCELIIANQGGAIVRVYPSGYVHATTLAERIPWWRQKTENFDSPEMHKLAEAHLYVRFEQIFDFGTHLLGVVDWYNPWPSGTPTVYQHLARVDASEIQLLRPLPVGKAVPYAGGPLRLLKVNGRLILFVADTIEEIDREGRTKRKLDQTPQNLALLGAVAGRWIVFDTKGRDTGLPLPPPQAYDLETGSFSSLPIPDPSLGTAFLILIPEFGKRVFYFAYIRSGPEMQLYTATLPNGTVRPWKVTRRLPLFAEGMLILSERGRVELYDPDSLKLLRRIDVAQS